MNIPEFKKLSPTTITSINYLNCLICVSSLYWFLPLTAFVVPKDKKKKIKIPLGNPGEILSVRYYGSSRGSIPSNKYFKNAITMDLSITGKNVSLKVSGNSIHITGCKSESQCKEALGVILGHINQLRSLKFTETDVSNIKILSKILLENVKKNKEPLSEENKKIIYSKVLDIVPCMNKFVWNWLDIESESNIILFAESIKNITTDFIISKIPVELEYNYNAMVNYNYDIGFIFDEKKSTINRIELVKAIDGLNGFLANFDNAIQHSVTVESIYDKKLSKSKNNKMKTPRQIFLIHKSGKVTHSGPGGELMEETYYNFMKTIVQIKDRILN